MGDEPEQINVQGLLEQLKKQQEAIEKLQGVPAIANHLAASQDSGTDAADKPYDVVSVGNSEVDHESEEGYNALLTGAGAVSNDSNLEEGEFEESIAAILEDVEKGAEFGPEVTAHVGSSFVKTVSRRLKKETSEKLKGNLRTPENCKLFIAPKMNSEIWRTLPSHARLEDLRKQQFQMSLTASLTALTNIADIVTRNSKLIPQDAKASILKTAIDAANVVGDQFQEISSSRRMDVRKYIAPQYAPMCSKEIAPSEWLFGNDLQEVLKTSKNETSLMRRGDRSSNRFVPYNSKRSSGGTSAPLNQFRSFGQFPRRGSSNNVPRGKFSYNQTQRYTPKSSSQPPFRHRQYQQP